MKKNFALFFLLFGLFSFDKTFAFSGLGSGTLSDPYQISNGTQLQEMTSSTTANYILINDIDFSGVATSTWNSGAGFIPINSFSGSLDGKGHKIIGLYINRPGTYNVGLFGDVNPYTTMSIKNIGLENVDITGCYLVGGIVGRMQSGTISNSYTTGKITATESYVGGLIGGNPNTNYSFTINDSYSRANISGKTYVAGLVGNPIGIMINVYSTGILSGTSGIGGLTSTSYGTAISSYWDIQTSGATTSTRGIGKTTSEMKSTSTFQTWNFNKVWDIDPEGIINDGYPYLNVFDDWTDTYHLETLSGSGTSIDPYIVTTCNQLQNIKNNLFAYYTLENDIDCSTYSYNGDSYGFYPIAINSSYPFRGSFDGKGYKITGLYMNYPNSSYIGLFGYVGSNISNSTTTIRNIGLEDVDITGKNYIGGITGYFNSGTISGVYTTGNIFQVDTPDAAYAGGLIGLIYSSYNAYISDSYSRINISGKNNIGGAIGNSSTKAVGNIYSTGLITVNGTPTSNIGGLVGYSNGSFTSTYWDTQTSGTTTSANGTGKTTEQMKSTSTYEGWNFNKIWTIDPEGIINDGYPYLNVFDDWTDTYHTETLSGSGTSIDPYTITTCNQLQNIKNNLFAYYTLENDIDCSTYSYNGDSYGFYPIAINSSYPFRGSFDGKGYKITGLYINRPTSDNVALFGCVGYGVQNSTTTIKNFGLEDVDITGKNRIAGIAGYFNSGTISEVYTTGLIKSTIDINAGGVGGLVGAMENSYNPILLDSYSKADIHGLTYVGGAIGSPGGTVKNIYSTGLIKIIGVSSYSFGGLVGYSNGSFTSTYWDTQTSGTTTSAKGTGKTTAEMQTQSTFSGWDFTNIWAMNGYPILRVMSNTLTYNADSNGSITGTTSQLVSTGGSGTEVTAIPNTGYHFVSWNDGLLTASRIDTNVLSSQSYTASFAINTYTVNYYSGENGSVTGDTSQTINYGGFASGVTAIPNTGYHFTSWSDGVLTASRTDVNITDNISVTANFEIDTHTLTYISGSHGTISGSSTQIVNYGSNGLQVEAVPDEDYRFVEWSDGSTSPIRTDYDIREDKSFTAEFVINQRTLSYTAGDNGTISGDTTQTVTIGQDGASVTAFPNTGYHFTSWSDGVLTASRTDTNITNSISVVASFAINTYTLSYTALEGGTISGSSTQIVNYGSNGMNVIATPDRRYRFISWSDNTTNTTRYESNVTQNIELSAIFKRNSKTYTSCTEYEYTEWSSCENGIQTRDLINAYPLGCIKNDSIIRQGCDIEEEKDNEEETKDTEPVIKIETSINPTTTIELEESSTKEIVIFTKNLRLGDIDEEVKLLQKFLNSQGFILTQTGAGSPSNETNKFGLLTKQALIKYQETHKEEILVPIGLSKGTGYFGKMTRDYINKLFD